MLSEPAMQYRQQPFDVDVEQALIGTLMIDPVWLSVVAAEIQDVDFYDPMHQRVYAAMQALAERESAVTPLTVGAEMAMDAGLKEVGGRKYLASLAVAAPAAANAREHAKIIRELSVRRQALTACENAADALATTSIAVPLALRGVLEAADDAAALSGKSRPKTLYEDALDMAEEAEAHLNGQPIEHVPTGLQKLDDRIGGLQGGDYMIVAGRPGAGKSAVMGCIAKAAAFGGANLRGLMPDQWDRSYSRPVIMFSHEMTKRQLNRRVICDIDFSIKEPGTKPLQYSRFRAGKATGDEIERAVRAAQFLHDLPLEVIPPGEIKSVRELVSRARSFAAQQDRMGLIVVDYLQIVPAGDRYAGSKVQEITEISNALMQCAKAIGWPLVAGAQINRNAENRDNKQPMLADLRESGAIEQDADLVLGIYRPAYYLEQRRPQPCAQQSERDEWQGEYDMVKNRMDILVLKNREGATGTEEVFCDMGASAIRDEKFQPEIRGLL